jgi:hypothetical protein
MLRTSRITGERNGSSIQQQSIGKKIGEWRDLWIALEQWKAEPGVDHVAG